MTFNLLKRIEIDITTRCNMACPNCDRAVPLAPSDWIIPVEDVQRFVDQSMRCSYYWETIGILGGEPLLHPAIVEIVNTIFHLDAEFVVLTTNGCDPRKARWLQSMHHRLIINDTEKFRYGKKPLYKFHCVQEAPIDFYGEQEDYRKGCLIPYHCGVGYNGKYWPCGAGSAIGRIFRIDCGIDRLEDLTIANMQEQMHRLCRYCGHWERHHVKRNGGPRMSHEQIVSPSWEKALREYRERI